LAGNVLDDIRKDTVYPLLETQGVTAGEFSFYQLIKQQMESKSTTAQYDGQDTANMTATQVLENKKQQAMKLGLALDGIIRFERDLALLRLKNILVHWTKAQDARMDALKGNLEDVFRTVTVEKSKYGKHQKSRKIIKFTKDVAKIKSEDPKGFAIMEAEEKNKRASGVDERYSFINPEVLRNLKATWYCTILPNDKKDDTLSRMILVQNIREAIEIFGPQSINAEKLKQRFAAVIGEDYDVWFTSENDMKELQSAMQGSDMKNPSPKPSMKQAMNV